MQASTVTRFGVGAGLLILNIGAYGALIDAGNGLINDTVLNITWTANGSLSGQQSWDDLVSWADNLVYAGFDDWRLASMSVSAGLPKGTAISVVNCSTATEELCRDNELGYMYTYNLPFATLIDVPGAPWSGTELDTSQAWWFQWSSSQSLTDSKSFQDYGWAVRDGQVPLLPLPGTPALLVLGLLGLALGRRGLAHDRLRNAGAV
jgi:hypothetical protein